MLLENFLKKRKQRVVLNGLYSSWEKILAGVPQGLVLGPPLFLIYTNDLPPHISSICKMFADGTLPFSKVKDSSLSLSDLDYDLETNHRAHQKMSFNLDPNKQEIEVLFSLKVNSDDHPKLTFNGNQAQQC